ncbi:hypothetical protein SDC9_83898 [bioreactor metagenome]|uniref:Uncharacterized protein n=1 Tax=bioreactor metagenome TaxID=1076179 RepID=A0A644Z9E6_9ZZZZ
MLIGHHAAPGVEGQARRLGKLVVGPHADGENHQLHGNFLPAFEDNGHLLTVVPEGIHTVAQ